MVLASAESQDIDVNLVAATNEGKDYWIKRTDSSNYTLTITPAGSDTIEDTESQAVAEDETWHICADGVDNWAVIATYYGPNSTPSFANLKISNGGYVGSVSDTDALQIEAGGNVVLTQSLIIGDAGNIIFDTTTGSKIGTSTTQKIGFWNTTPVVQPTAVADATGAGDVVAQLNALLARIRAIGLIAS